MGVRCISCRGCPWHLLQGVLLASLQGVPWGCRCIFIHGTPLHPLQLHATSPSRLLCALHPQMRDRESRPTPTSHGPGDLSSLGQPWPVWPGTERMPRPTPSRTTANMPTMIRLSRCAQLAFLLSSFTNAESPSPAPPPAPPCTVDMLKARPAGDKNWPVACTPPHTWRSGRRARSERGAPVVRRLRGGNVPSRGGDQAERAGANSPLRDAPRPRASPLPPSSYL